MRPNFPLPPLAILAAAALLASPLAAQESAAPTPAPTEVEPAIPAQSAEDMALIERITDLGGGVQTKLAPDYIYRRLLRREDSEKISQAFEAALIGIAEDTTAALIRALELDFIHSGETSSLDLLNPELSEHFGDFEWHEDDYYGGKEGPNEKLSDVMVDALDIVSPERRANRSRTAVVLRSEATEQVWDYMLAQWEPVPDEGEWKLNKHAKAAYLRLREAAAADGVDMTIQSGHRDPKRAAANAARVGNPYAVASFSSHSLGLAIDFVLPKAGGEDQYRLTTSPMSEVVEMRKSPVHKWLHLYGHEFGWFPFQHEPWHWEYNPQDFRDVFFSEFEGGTPERQPVVE